MNYPTMQYFDYIASFDAVIRDYIPKQLLVEYSKMEKFYMSDGGVQRLEIIMTKSGSLLRMYGQPIELQEDLMKIWNFPYNFCRFSGGSAYTIPVKYQNLKGELFYCKQDLFLHLRAATFSSYRQKQIKVPNDLEKFLTDHLQSLRESFEFVKYDQEIFYVLNAAFPHSKNLQKESPEEEEDDFYENTIPSIPTNEGPTDYLNAFETLIRIYPQVFLPNIVLRKWKAPLCVVRIFEDGDQKFVMECELFYAINLLNRNNTPIKLEKTHEILRTRKLKEVFTTYRDSIKGIEFIRSSIHRAKHAAVPIVTPSGDHCILISDFIVEKIRRLILGLNIFQKLEKKMWPRMMRFVNMILSCIPRNLDSIGFIKLKVVDEFRLIADEYWKKFEKNRNVVQVRNVGERGFTTEDLKEELKLLGLDRLFSDISDFVEPAFLRVMESKKMEKLRTCDLYDAVEYCQMSCFFSRFTSLVKVIHTQSACHRIPHGKSYLCSQSVPFTFNSHVKEVKEKEKFEDTKSIEENVLENSPDEEEIKEEIIEKDNELSSTENEKTPSIEENAQERSIEEADIKENINEKEKELSLTENREINKETLSITKGNAQESSIDEADIKENTDEKEKELSPIENEKTQIDLITCERCLRSFDLFKMTKIKLENVRLREENYIEMKKYAEEAQQEIKKLCEQLKESKLSEAEHLKVIQSNDLLLNESWNKCRNLELKITDMEKKYKKTTNLVEETKNLSKSVQKKLKENEKEITQLKQSNANTLKSKKKEIEALQLTASKSANQIKMLTSELESSKIKMKEANDISEKLKQREFEISEKYRIMEELKTANLKLISDQEASRKMFRESMSQISNQFEEHSRIMHKLLGQSSPSNMTSESSLVKNESNSLEIQLKSLQKIRDLMETSDSINIAKEMVEKLISLSDRTEIRQFSKYEFQRYEGKLRNYGQVVELNIHNLEITDDISCIIPLPEFPSFSDKFMTEYWAEIDKKPSIELSDAECYICFSEMKSDEKTLECEHCKKITHLECASKWLQIHRSCGHCRQKQLDPNEFPALG